MNSDSSKELRNCDRQLQANGIKHEYHLYPGNHGAEYFLAHLGEVMQFHSRMFAAGR